MTEEALIAALGDLSQGPPDFAAAAEALGVTEEALMDALGIAEGGMPPARWSATCWNTINSRKDILKSGLPGFKNLANLS